MQKNKEVFNKLTILKRHNQAKNHPKTNILFCLFDISIICEQVHRMQLRNSFKIWVAVTTWQVYQKPRLSVIPVFLILDLHI